MEKFSHFSDSTPVYFNITVSGTPNNIEDETYYGEVNYYNPKKNKKIIIWYSYIYSSSFEAYTECYKKMQEYITKNPIIDL